MKKKTHLEDPRVIRNRLILTPDDWHPTIDGHVRASLLLLISTKFNKEGWRVCFWGGDDFGLEHDFFSYEEAKEMFELTTNVGSISISDLIGLGFVHA